MFEAGQADEREHRARPLVRVQPRHPLHLQTEAHVAQDVAVREQHVVLEHQPEIPPVGCDPREVASVDGDASRARRFEAGDRAQKGALPTPARPEHTHHFAFRHREIHAVERKVISVADGEFLDLEHRVASYHSPAVPTRNRSMASTTIAVKAARIVLAAMAAPKLCEPGWLSRR